MLPLLWRATPHPRGQFPLRDGLFRVASAKVVSTPRIGPARCPDDDILVEILVEPKVTEAS